MRIIVIVSAVLIAMAGTALGVPQGEKVEFDGNGGGKVIFDGTVHAKVGKRCPDCHPSLFMMNKGTTAITMKSMFNGENCGFCHNGKGAFDARSLATCKKCHKREKKPIVTTPPAE